jgi:threonine dehydratase
VMPKNAPAVKCKAVEAYGGKITFCEPKVSARNEAAARIQAETGAVMIHPYDDDRIIAGQATAAKELLEETGELDALLAPVSGGGLLSGSALSAKHIRPEIRVYGCEPAKADDAYRSKQVRCNRSNRATPSRTDYALRWRRERLRFCRSSLLEFFWSAKKRSSMQWH